MGDDIIGKQVFSGDETWDRNDDSDRKNLMNRVLKENEDLLKEARESFTRRGSSSEREPGYQATRFAMAFELLQQATWKAAQDNRADEEKFNKLLQEFQDIADHRGLNIFQLEEEARKSAKQHQLTDKLRTLLEEKGNRMLFLTRKVVSGTEAVTEGSSDDEDDGPIEDEG